MNDLKLEREVNAVFLSRPARHERGERLRHGFHEFSRMVLDEKQSVLIRAIRVFSAIRVHSCPFVVSTSIT